MEVEICDLDELTGSSLSQQQTTVSSFSGFVLTVSALN